MGFYKSQKIRQKLATLFCSDQEEKTRHIIAMGTIKLAMLSDSLLLSELGHKEIFFKYKYI